MQHYGLKLNIDKCLFAVPELTFLGHVIDENGLAPLDEKVKAISEFPPPSTLRQLRRFIGMINYYRRFIRDCAIVLLPLTNLLSNHKRKNPKIVLSADELDSFRKAKQALQDCTKLVYITSSPDAKLTLTTDASSDTVGAVLHQIVDGVERPLSFFSIKLNTAQQKYSTFSRELLAIYLAIRHYRHILEGRDFSIFTDHKPLTYALHAKSDKHNPRDIRYMDYISQFSSDIRYISGASNTVADTLSRTTLSAVQSTTLNFDNLADEQDKDETLQAIHSDTSLKIEKRPLPFTNRSVYCDISTGNPRPYIPPNMRRLIFEHFHTQAHPGGKATLRTISDRFIWPGMAADIKQWSRTCLRCQATKVGRHTRAPTSTLPTQTVVLLTCMQIWWAHLKM